MRTRSFLIPEKAQMLGFDRQMVQREMCSASVPLCEGISTLYIIHTYIIIIIIFLYENNIIHEI